MAFNLNCYSAIIDSVLFSTDGKYVLIREGDYLNECDVDWWRLYPADLNKDDEYIAIFPDSVFALKYKNPDSIPTFHRKDCSTFAILIDQYLIKDFINKYNLTLKSTIKKGELNYKTDTVRSYLKKTDSNKKDKYYDFIVIFLKQNQTVLTDTITSNSSNPEFHFDFTLYYSEDNRFYFIYGKYSYEDFVPMGLKQTSVYVRYIGKNNP